MYFCRLLELIIERLERTLKAGEAALEWFLDLEAIPGKSNSFSFDNFLLLLCHIYHLASSASWGIVVASMDSTFAVRSLALACSDSCSIH
jgi:hypothetical protein